MVKTPSLEVTAFSRPENKREHPEEARDALFDAEKPHPGGRRLTLECVREVWLGPLFS